MRKMIPVARRVLGSCHIDTLKLNWLLARARYQDPSATPDDLRESLTMLEDTARTARRVLGGAHPLTKGADCELHKARATLEVREAGFDSISDALAAMNPGDA